MTSPLSTPPFGATTLGPPLERRDAPGLAEDPSDWVPVPTWEEYKRRLSLNASQS